MVRMSSWMAKCIFMLSIFGLGTKPKYDSMYNGTCMFNYIYDIENLGDEQTDH